MLDLLKSFADHKDATLAQVSLTWLLAKWPFLTPIPGSRKAERINEDLRAAEVELSSEDLYRIERQLADVSIHGNRTDEDVGKLRGAR